MNDNDIVNKVSNSLFFKDKFRMIYNLFGYSNLMKIEDTEKTVYIDKLNNNVLLTKSFQVDNPNMKVSITPPNF